MAKLTLILLGAPGSGKGTLSERLIKKYHIPEISSGEILRKVSHEKGELAREVKKLLDGGNLAPDDLIIELMKRRISRPDCKNGFILDGFPRNVSQAEELDKITNIDWVIELSVTKKTVLDRLSGRRTCRKCGRVYHIRYNPPKTEGKCDVCGGDLYHRSDDKPSAINNRLELYIEQTKPVIGHYKKKGILLQADAEQHPDKIFEHVLKELEK